MRLERRVHRVGEIAFGGGTSLADGRLLIDREALRELVLADDRVTVCRVELAEPGDDARVVHICDTVEPEWGASGPGFRGWDSEIQTVGHGVTHRLQGVGVTACCELPWRKTGGIQIPRENIAELRGPLAELSPLGSVHNVILELTLRDELPDEECDLAVHRAELRGAEFLARTPASGRGPDDVEVSQLND